MQNSSFLRLLKNLEAEDENLVLSMKSTQTDSVITTGKAPGALIADLDGISEELV